MGNGKWEIISGGIILSKIFHLYLTVSSLFSICLKSQSVYTKKNLLNIESNFLNLGKLVPYNSINPLPGTVFILLIL